MADDTLAALDEGPARLSRDEVAASQRRRLTAAMVAAVAEKGYVNTSVADVVARARVSRATFYEQFADKTECFLAAFDACLHDLVGRLRERGATRAAPRERLRASLEAYFDTLSRFPEAASVCLVEVYAVGRAAIQRRRRSQAEFIELLRGTHAALAEAGEPVRPMTDFDFEALVGAISSLVTNRVASNETHLLSELAAPTEVFVLSLFGLEAQTSS